MAGSPTSARSANLRHIAEDTGFRSRFSKSKREAKVRFANWLKSHSGQIVDPDTIFDCQIKRIHEYKRQMLNALRILSSTTGCERIRS